MNISIIIPNHITRRRRNQQNFKDIFPSLDFQGKLEENFSLLSKGQLMLLNKLIQFDGRYDQIYCSQSYLASLIGYSREQVNRMLTELESLGLVRLLYRHINSSVYRVSSIFRDYSIRSRLKHIFNALDKFHISMLFPFKKSPVEVDSEKMSHNIKGEESYIYNPTTTKDSHYTGRSVVGVDFQKKIREKHMLLPSEKKLMLEQLSQGIMPDNFPSQAIKNINCLQLTMYGQVQLSSFPDFIITKAVEEIKSFKSFGALFNACIKLCKEQNVRPDVYWVNDLKRTLKLTGSESPVIASFVKPTSTVPIQQKFSAQWKPDPTRIDIDPQKERESEEVQDHIKLLTNGRPDLAYLFGDLLKRM